MLQDNSNFWADLVADQAIARNKDIVISTGITPSGEIHIGNMREVLTGDAVFRSLKKKTDKISFHYIADNFDPLRKVYPFLDAEIYEQYVGMPISRIPCPCGQHDSYSEHFLIPFVESLKKLDIDVEVKRSSQLYESGEMNNAIFSALEKREEIASILNKKTGKEISQDWSPFNPICADCKKMTTTKLVGFSRENNSIDYECSCGSAKTVDVTGNGKLTWRIDWPARWSVLKVLVEPFGKDHASRGGSYDTGVEIAKEVFDCQAPVPIIYEWISLKGQGDMSSSKGNVLSIDKTLEVLPPEVLRYMVFKVQPKKAITFDPGLGILNIINEYDEENANRNQRAYELSSIRGIEAANVPFKHMVNLVQIAADDVDQIIHILKRTGYEIVSKAAVADRAFWARKWLDRFAPESMRFEIKQEVPSEALTLSEKNKEFLEYIAEHAQENYSGDDFHKLIYEGKEKFELEPSEAFRAIYISMLGQEKGPRAGWFLATLDNDFIKKRFTSLLKG
ncbi:MAG: lysine--tRNA ligase [Pseudomonadota bacterium]